MFVKLLIDLLSELHKMNIKMGNKRKSHESDQMPYAQSCIREEKQSRARK
jgi:hypothetical protein